VKITRQRKHDQLSVSVIPLVLLILLGLLATGTLAACNPQIPTTETERVRTGAEILRDTGFEALSGKRVGLITNQTAVVDSVHLIDLLNDAPDVNLVALFGPEHGLRGETEAGAAVEDGMDTATGLPVYSLYGTSNAPSDDVLASLDVLVFDIQDIGARFYTYITTMGRSMQAAARAGVPFVVLDRPNPLGGLMVDGYVLEADFKSGVGAFPIPIQHGLTVGELALMIQGEEYLSDLEELDLEIISMTGWSRDMLWPATGLPWIPTSPNIPTFETALVYAGTCFVEALSASEGRGTPAPFLTIGAPWLNADEAVQRLISLQLPGVSFSASVTTPKTIPGIAENPLFEDQLIKTIQIDVTDINSYVPLKTGIATLKSVIDLAPDSMRANLVNRRWMALLSGSERLANALEDGRTAGEIVSSWSTEVETFRRLSATYLLYD